MPPTPSLRRLAVVALLSVGLTLAVVSFFPTGVQSDTSPHVGHNTSKRLAELDGISATVETELTRGNETTRMVQRVHMRPRTGKVRVEVISGEETSSNLIVSNGSVMWLYDREANEVMRIRAPEYTSVASRQGDRIERLFNRLNVSRSAVNGTESIRPTPNVSPLPVVPQLGRTATPARPVDGRFGVTYNGTDTIDGREVYVLTVRTPENGSSSTLGNYTQTMYVDTEWFLPLKTHTEWTTDGERFVSETTFQNVTFNPGLDDALFEFEPPANATVEELSTPTVEQYESLSALRANTSVSVPEPGLPKSFDFRSAQLTSGQYRSVRLQFANATTQVIISKTNRTGTNATGTDGEAVTVGTHEGTYNRIATNSIISWECNGFRYSVMGARTSKAFLLHIAESIECG